MNAEMWDVKDKNAKLREHMQGPHKQMHKLAPDAGSSLADLELT
jgi:hypothetical protein